MSLKKHIFLAKQLWDVIKMLNCSYQICLVSFIEVYSYNTSNNAAPIGKRNGYNIIILLSESKSFIAILWRNYID